MSFLATLVRPVSASVSFVTATLSVLINSTSLSAPSPSPLDFRDTIDVPTGQMPLPLPPQGTDGCLEVILVEKLVITK